MFTRLGFMAFHGPAFVQAGGSGPSVIHFSYGLACLYNTTQTEVLWSYALPIYY